MRWATWIGYLTILGGIGGICFGIWSIYDQHRKITSFESVDAIVLSHRIEDQKTKVVVLQIPVVEYEYIVAGKRYVSDSTTPTECAGTKDWTEAVFAAYPVDAHVRARADPRRPSDSYLIAKYGSEPYLIVLVTVVITGMGVGVVFEQIAESDTPRESQESMHGSLLQPKRDHRSSPRSMGSVALLGLLVGTPVSVHYLLVSTPPHDKLYLLLNAAYGFAVLVLLVWSSYGYWTTCGFGAPELRITNARPAIGETLRVSVTLPTRFNGTVERMTLRLRCVAKKTAWFDISGEDPDTLLVEQRKLLFHSAAVQSHGSLEGRAEFTVPPQSPASSPANEKASVRIVWTLHLEGKASRWRSLKRVRPGGCSGIVTLAEGGLCHQLQLSRR